MAASESPGSTPSRQDGPPEYSSLVMAALLLLVLAFAADWILEYAARGEGPWDRVPWFAGAAGVIVVVSMVGYLIKTRFGRAN